MMPITTAAQVSTVAQGLVMATKPFEQRKNVERTESKKI
jgi:hypothetical protein